MDIEKHRFGIFEEYSPPSRDLLIRSVGVVMARGEEVTRYHPIRLCPEDYLLTTDGHRALGWGICRERGTLHTIEGGSSLRALRYFDTLEDTVRGLAAHYISTLSKETLSYHWTRRGIPIDSVAGDYAFDDVLSMHTREDAVCLIRDIRGKYLEQGLGHSVIQNQHAEFCLRLVPLLVPDPIVDDAASAPWGMIRSQRWWGQLREYYATWSPSRNRVAMWKWPLWYKKALPVIDRGRRLPIDAPEG